MSYPIGGKTLSSSMAYHESLPTDESGAASLSSQLNLYNSKLASSSSSQPCAENTFYRDGNRYSLPHNHGLQQEQLHYEAEQIHTSLTVPELPRSSPISIKRASWDKKREVVESDIDDDESEIDVEGDAIKLQRKYGNKIIQSYIPESTIAKSSTARMRDKSSVLNAPYLGSLSKSSNQVLSLPPISLAGDSTFLGEPPDSIISYGSLRDSHERGRFLDGPSSYREPMSGKIRQLDHRLRYHGRQPELNIGERLQQSRKLKELRLKEENKKKGRSNNNAKAENINDEKKKERKEAKSSLSAMMRDAPKNINTVGAGVDDFREGNSFLSTERLIPIQLENVASSNTYEHRSSMNQSPMNMLSTSLTAFELLKSSNTDTSFGGNIANQSYSVARITDTDQTIDFRNSSGFQPLSRSMSAPSPRFQNLSLSKIPASSGLPAIQTTGLATKMKNALTDVGQLRNSIQLQQGTELTNNYSLANNAQFTCEGNATTNSTSLTPDEAAMFSNDLHRSPHSDHDPSTDGAFGDMDL